MFPEIQLPEGPFEGYIFDCDGTLANSMPAHFKAWKAAFKTHGAKFEFTWDIFYAEAGRGLSDSIAHFNRIFDERLCAETVGRTYLENMQNCHAAIRPIEPVLSLARRLSIKAPVAVASGGTRHHVHETLKAIGAGDLFPVVITQDDVLNRKPAPDCFLLAAQRMGVTPSRCLVFEDARLGIEAAFRAGMQVVYIDPAVYTSSLPETFSERQG